MSHPFVEFRREELEQSVTARFEQQASLYPKRTAAQSRNHHLTYEQLNRTANRLARAVLACDPRGEGPVALLLENEAPALAAFLAVLKTGKIYVPLDPAIPEPRLAYILEDSQSPLIVTNVQHLAMASRLAGKRISILNMDDLPSGLSGDNGVLRPDGCLIHVGRKDFQVKIRGHRVELAEIETTLLESGLVKDAVVIPRSDTGGEQYLAAYVVPQADTPPTSSALRRAVAAALPDFLVPSVFVQLDALPLTTSGKIDRRALPESPARRPDLDQQFVPPRNGLEETLSGVWSEVLGIAPIGRYDNFFELGGHSLRATQVAARLHKILRIEAPLDLVLQSPTIAELAARLGGHR